VKVELDREKARTLGIPVNDVFQSMSAVLGGAYVNDFNRFGRLFRVYVQADADYRRKPDDIGQIYVRSNTTNTMIPLSTLVTIREVPSTEITTRFNLFRSVEISGVPGPATSVRPWRPRGRLPKTMPKEMGFASQALLPGEGGATRGTDLSHGDRLRVPPAGRDVRELAPAVGGCSGRPSSPRRVLRRLARGTITTCTSRWTNHAHRPRGQNAILIVEVAKVRHEEGKPAQEAALEAARLRFRPILMTAFAFILGVVPLMRASGAGAGAQNVMGTAVFWGMLVATFLGVFIIPGNFAFVEQLGRRHKRAKGLAQDPAHEPPRPGSGRSTRETRIALIGLALALAACTVGLTTAGRRSRCRRCSAGSIPAAPPSRIARRPRVVDDLPGRGPPAADPNGPDRELRPPARREPHPDAQAQVVITRSNQFPVIEGTAQAPLRRPSVIARRFSRWRTRSSRRRHRPPRSSSTWPVATRDRGRPRRSARD
jgi:hypothetical protein